MIRYRSSSANGKLITPRPANLMHHWPSRSAATERQATSGIKFHLQQIQKLDKGVGDIPLNKVVDFRLLEEIRREMLK